FYGFAVMCSDHPEVESLITELTDRRIVTYGFNNKADVRAVNVRGTAKGSHFDAVFSPWLAEGPGETVRDFWLPMLGHHNVQNALAVLAIAHEMGMDFESMKKALSGFTGVKRRFTRTGESHGVTIIDDYGHHPVEIAAVLKAARMAASETQGRVIAVIQPHRYSRLASLFDDFCGCIGDADTVIVADVYAAGEKPVEGCDKTHLAKGIKRAGHRDVHVLESVAVLADMIAEKAQSGDFVICLGAGDITKWAQALPGELDEIFARTPPQAALAKKKKKKAS
ncbi:MAG TPA: cyanophycin synthetase, partial [Alphaproteobacteria bacterium]